VPNGIRANPVARGLVVTRTTIAVIPNTVRADKIREPKQDWDARGRPGGGAASAGS
jgi:hypothetical protein